MKNKIKFIAISSLFLLSHANLTLACTRVLWNYNGIAKDAPTLTINPTNINLEGDITPSMRKAI